ncbi:MAG TPA: hypothetical protein VNH11_33535 [Pirellulales bacterium]|nr:hypothetical protein [Pirellulales bacterium]
MTGFDGSFSPLLTLVTPAFDLLDQLFHLTRFLISRLAGSQILDLPVGLFANNRYGTMATVSSCQESDRRQGRHLLPFPNLSCPIAIPKLHCHGSRPFAKKHGFFIRARLNYLHCTALAFHSGSEHR